MGGRETGQPLYPEDKVPMKDLVYRYQSGGKAAEGDYSDEYTRSLFEDRKKRMDDLMIALSRLGILDQLAPQGMVPRMPYRPIEQEFGF